MQSLSSLLLLPPFTLLHTRLRKTTAATTRTERHSIQPTPSLLYDLSALFRTLRLTLEHALRHSTTNPLGCFTESPENR
uniref:Putative secreted protein n=1 Tax=Anopheles triannulatus TaxID=58253 RepID=A0A2M4B372_9DIPT